MHPMQCNGISLLRDNHRKATPKHPKPKNICNLNPQPNNSVIEAQHHFWPRLGSASALFGFSKFGRSPFRFGINLVCR